MSKKKEFIDFIEKCIEVYPQEMPDNVKMYWDAFKIDVEDEKPTFTDNGKMVLNYMREHQTDMPTGKAKDIAEGLFITSRQVSGTLRKLVSDGYVEKLGKDPILYSLTELGKTVEVI